MSDPNRKAEKAAKAAEMQRQYTEEIAGLEFREWPKISRLNRDIVITEKLDGTNGAIGIIRICAEGQALMRADDVVVNGDIYRVYAQSRTRIVTPGNDNYGFAAWVRKNAAVLVRALGEGLHFGEWWGVGINRGYGLSERRFSLFNTAKWGVGAGAQALSLARNEGVAIYAVPVLYTGPWMMSSGFSPQIVREQLVESEAAPGFMNPEGIVIYHQAGSVCFKATIEGDDAHKSQT